MHDAVQSLAAEPAAAYAGQRLAGAVRRSVSTQFHPGGTCAIGIVVDSRLRIRGVRNLRVAHASVIPSIPSMNPNATVVAIAERAAALLTEDVGGVP
ncbi:GMC oxidoreductase [Pseudonocardia alaniniphila]|uniref:GMC family oxidoreductase n=1 Tax=Pseudonocardia alaniniphila TaxID=75291 RepID=A0ABS9TV37_9PSEU|nr:GMC family oxidoreductase [Pseudonocardia alaniniphila]MCH6172425.1 GMC family oxidoreductase [Pseudonocardia alaniniphila]